MREDQGTGAELLPIPQAVQGSLSVTGSYELVWRCSPGHCTLEISLNTHTARWVRGSSSGGVLVSRWPGLGARRSSGERDVVVAPSETMGLDLVNWSQAASSSYGRPTRQTELEPSGLAGYGIAASRVLEAKTNRPAKFQGIFLQSKTPPPTKEPTLATP